MAYRKKFCYVVYAYYRDDEDLPDGYEEEVYTNYSAALAAKEQWEQDPDIEHVELEEDVEREVWVEDDEAMAIDLKTKENGWLLATLDDEVQKYAKMNNVEWAQITSRSYYLAVMNEIRRRLNNPLDDPLMD